MSFLSSLGRHKHKQDAAAELKVRGCGAAQRRQPLDSSSLTSRSLVLLTQCCSPDPLPSSLPNPLPLYNTTRLSPLREPLVGITSTTRASSAQPSPSFDTTPAKQSKGGSRLPLASSSPPSPPSSSSPTLGPGPGRLALDSTRLDSAAAAAALWLLWAGTTAQQSQHLSPPRYHPPAALDARLGLVEQRLIQKEH